ncbi:MAG: efflux RND transporter periplasmic adaptor subunit [Deferribacterales bacterium]
MKRYILTGSAILLLICIAVFIIVGRKPEKKDEISSAAMTVTTSMVRRIKLAETVSAAGSIAPWREAVIASEISGQRLGQILADIGDRVTKGQVLARFKTDTLLAERAELKAAWDQADADALRALALKGTGAMSEQTIDGYMNTAAGAKARLDSKDLQIGYAAVTAPDSGIISSSSAILGAVGSQGQELFRIIRQGRLEWRGELTPGQLNRVGKGQTVVLKLSDGGSAEAVISRIAPSLDDKSRMATVYADIKNGSSARAGMYCEGVITLPETPALVLPSESVVVRDGFSYVFSIESSEKGTFAVRRKVETGRIRRGLTEIISGVGEKDIIAVRGAGFLNDRDAVTVITK